MASIVTASGVDELLKNTDSKPCLQVLGLEKMANNRFKCNLFDGKASVEAVISTSSCPWVEDGSLVDFGVIRLGKCSVVAHNGLTKVMVMEAEVAEKTLGEKVAAGINTPAVGDKRKSMTSSPPSAAKPSSHKSPAGSRRVQPLDSLNPYGSSWTIKARVTNKGPMRTFTQKASGQPGNVFSIEIQDEQGTEMKVTMWHETAEKWSEKMEVGQVYFISRGKLKTADRKYMTVNNDYEMSLDNSSLIEEAEDDMAPVVLNYNFVTFDNLGSQIGAKIPFDVIGVVQTVGELGSVKRKSDGGELLRRDITLLDSQARTVSLTAWNEFAEKTTAPLVGCAPGTVLACKGVRASDYNGVSLSTLSKTNLLIDADLSESKELKAWYEAEGSTAPTTSAGAGLASARSPGQGNNIVESLMDIQPEELAAPSAPATWHNVRAVLTRFSTKGTMWYSACPQEGCNKKVTEDMGQWYCESHQQSFPECKRRWIAQVQVMDNTGPAWLATFNDQAMQIIGTSADEVAGMRDSSEEQFNSFIKTKCWQPFTMRIKSKTDDYNSELRRRLTVQTVQPMDFAVESRRLLQAIQAM